MALEQLQFCLLISSFILNHDPTQIGSIGSSYPIISAGLISVKLLQSKLNFEIDASIEGTDVALKWILQSSFKT